MDNLQVRVDFEIYQDENNKHVLVFEVASRPIGFTCPVLRNCMVAD